MDNSQFNAFLADVKKRARALEGEEYLGEDVRKVLRDFLQVSESFNALQTDTVSLGADARLFKKRYEQAKSDLKAAERRIELLKSAGIGCVIPTKQLSSEISSVTDSTVAARLKAHVQKIAEALIEISKI